MRLALAVVLVLIGGIYGASTQLGEVDSERATQAGSELSLFQDDLGHRTYLSLWEDKARTRRGAGLDAHILPDVQGATALEATGEPNSVIETSRLGGAGDEEDGTLASLICGYDWPCSEAERIVWCESRFDPLAISWTGESFGLFQLHAATWASYFPDFWLAWDDPEVNTSWAWEIYKRAGYSFSPWDCRP